MFKNKVHYNKNDALGYIKKHRKNVFHPYVKESLFDGALSMTVLFNSIYFVFLLIFLEYEYPFWLWQIDAALCLLTLTFYLVYLPLALRGVLPLRYALYRTYSQYNIPMILTMALINGSILRAAVGWGGSLITWKIFHGGDTSKMSYQYVTTFPDLTTSLIAFGLFLVWINLMFPIRNSISVKEFSKRFKDFVYKGERDIATIITEIDNTVMNDDYNRVFVVQMKEDLMKAELIKPEQKVEHKISNQPEVSMETKNINLETEQKIEKERRKRRDL